jgi:hypothetical protein
MAVEWVLGRIYRSYPPIQLGSLFSTVCFSFNWRYDVHWLDRKVDVVPALEENPSGTVGAMRLDH